MEIKAILEFVKRTNPDITEKQLVEALAIGYNSVALGLMAQNVK